MTVTWTPPPTFVNGNLVAASDLNTALRDNFQYLYNAIPNRTLLWHHQALSTTGNALARTYDANQYQNLYAYQNAGANGDKFTQGFYLRAGTYTFYIIGLTGSNSGKVDWTLDGAASPFMQGQDWYSASTTYNVIKSVANVLVTGSGYHKLQGKINGQNGASTGFNLKLTAYYFMPTVAD